MTGEEQRRLRSGIGAIVARHHPDGAAALTAEIWEAIDGALCLMPGPSDDDPGSLSRADVWRLRVAKLLARLLPPERYRDRALRRRIRGAIRQEVVAVLGVSALAPSPYLDPGGDACT